MTNQNIATLPDEDLSNPKSASLDATLSTSTEDAASVTDEQAPMALKDRFRKFLPVVVDVETAGFNAQTDALLEIACIPVLLNEQGVFYPGEAFNAHIEPFEECRQCVLIGHNAHFDLAFLNAAVLRTNSKNHNPFHNFSVFDTVTLSALAFGQTVLARACKAAGLEFDGKNAHSALYDTQKTAELFCHILNNYPMLANALHNEDAKEESADSDSQ